MKQYQKALSDYSRAIEQDPFYAQAYNNRGILFATFKKFEQADADFSKALAVDPGFTEARHNLELARRSKSKPVQTVSVA